MSITTKLQSIEEHLENAYISLNNMGMSTDNKNINNLAGLVDQIYENAPKTDYYEGTDLSVENSLKGKIDFKDDNINILAYGNTSQKTYEGYQLFNINGNVSSGSLIKYNNGLTLVKGTNRYVQIDLPKMILSGTYNISFDIINNALSSNNNFYCSFKKAGINVLSNVRIISTNTITLSDEVDRLYLFIADTETDEATITIDNLLLVAGSEEKNFEPYVGGQASPNPSYPQTIEVVKGQNNVKIENKNLFNNNNYEKGYSYIGTTKSANVNWGIYNLECLKDEEYVISGLKPYANVSIVQLDKNKNPIVELQRRNSTSITYTITATEDGFIAVTFLWNEVGQGSELNTMQIEKDTTSSPYVPHQEQNYTITLPNGMEMASNPTGITRDEIVGTYNNWKINRKIGKVVLNGSENLNFNASLTNVNRFNIIINGFKNILSSSSGYCNQLPILNSFDGDSEHIYIYNNNCFIFYNKNRCADVNELKTYLNNNNLILYGTLATSIEEPITDTTLINQLNMIYKRAQSYNEKTYITINNNTDLPIKLKVRALKSN